MLKLVEMVEMAVVRSKGQFLVKVNSLNLIALFMFVKKHTHTKMLICSQFPNKINY